MYDLAHGVLGLRGIHTFQAAGGAVQMHGQHRPDLGSWIKLDEIAGLTALPDYEPATDAATAKLGEIAYPSRPLGKTIVYTGRLCSKTLAGLEQLGATLRGRLAYRSGSMTSAPHPAYGAGGYFTPCEVLQYEPEESQTRGRNAVPTPWQREFTLGIRLHDPRWMWVGLSSQTHSPGGAQIVNLGHAFASPKITARNPGARVEARNRTTGRGLVLEGVPAGARVFFNFHQHSIARPTYNEPVDSPNTNMDRYLVHNDSDWWDADVQAALQGGLIPGAQTIAVTGCSSWTCEWRHTSW